MSQITRYSLDPSDDVCCKLFFNLYLPTGFANVFRRLDSGFTVKSSTGMETE
jgi:hypothetical protein